MRLYFRKISLLSFILLIGSVDTAFSQHELFDRWDSLLLEKANTGKDLNYLSDDEKNVILFINMARMNPPLFYETVIRPYIREMEITPSEATRSIRLTMEKLRPLPPLQPRKDLYVIAKEHATRMGREGRIGHHDYKERTRKIKQVYYGISENCDYGFKDGRQIVARLLIDEGVPGYGHRKSILDPDFRYIGTSIQPHAKWDYNCVQEFGGPLIKEMELE